MWGIVYFLGVTCAISMAILIWLYTPSGKRWLKNN